MTGKNKVLIVFFILLLIAVSACNPEARKKKSTDGVKGTNGLIIKFVENSPQDSYLMDEEEEDIFISLEVRNKGAYPEEDEQNVLSRGQVYLGGFDKTIIEMDDISKRLNAGFLTGLSSINPEGGFDTMEFEGVIEPYTIVDKYEPTILATLCYPYTTKASPSVCIDPFPFDDKQKKVCKIGSQALSSQGAPIMVTSVDQEASSSRMQFKINIKNVGNGDAVRFSSLEKCDPSGDERIDRDDIDRVELVNVRAGLSSLTCGPFADNRRNIRLYNNEGFVICTLDRADFEDANSAYTTPLNIELRYGYRSTISKKIKISKITSVS
ncbi:MAG: hypothetical protein QF436_02655 [Candidatus Woesearchaeota archaeon]|mgnify:CR=1 FL=1|jgi:hypothetical protein|nr:hypothetical protein [Candidatus Woesearchaeota archaeon]MDP7622992.1 hypothetical protein [Candidatus Woesearchaeota archaeon]HJN56377.1 hypothetical protein [Candidatus Woesearchaeota archaeon]|tara:strand:- start:4253 stop:5224 length:972 start_codon:yes stop_codon:yes gene_type:complete